jgi:hypothetical protein
MRKWRQMRVGGEYTGDGGQHRIDKTGAVS